MPLMTAALSQVLHLLREGAQIGLGLVCLVVFFKCLSNWIVWKWNLRVGLACNQNSSIAAINICFPLLVSHSFVYSLQWHLGVRARRLVLHQDPFWVWERDAPESGLQPGRHLQSGGHPLRRQTGQLAGDSCWQRQAAAGERNHSQQEQVKLESSQWLPWTH